MFIPQVSFLAFADSLNMALSCKAKTSVFLEEALDGIEDGLVGQVIDTQA